MLSLENSYNTQDLIDWDVRLNGLVDHQKVHFSVEPKFDGASISLIYENDLLVRGATRGDGAEGDDITTTSNRLVRFRYRPIFLIMELRKLRFVVRFY
jgi:DNA ligase (NAD+)